MKADPEGMSSEPRSDEELIAAIQRKDVRALEELYDRHRVLAFSLALRVLGNATDAEDVLQESFLNVWRASQTYRPERSSGRSWIMTIVHHRSIDKLRGRKSRPQPVGLEEGMDLPAEGDVWRDVAQALTGQDVRRALDRLPREQRETIELAYFQGYTHSQIAQLMEVPLGTVKGRMRIGLHKLKSLLESSQTGLAVD
ncbi:MAG: sigma-70 family RNA polymerase sigma factor [Chloroflexi bacterium]|nr:sigma-70 family RNA polymerase sigma factor [Chloroflexota bacterium]